MPACPRCRFPVSDSQPQLAVHTGTDRSPDGYMEDRFEVFHRPCARAHLIEKAHAKKARQHAPRTRTTERKAS